MEDSSKDIVYSKSYTDDVYEYRHVILPEELANLMPKNRLLEEHEWRQLGVRQSLGWVHFMIHRPEKMKESSDGLQLDPDFPDAAKYSGPIENTNFTQDNQRNMQSVVAKPLFYAENNEKGYFYKVLGVDRHADQDTIKNAYRKLALIYHPDKSVNKDEAQKMMQNINRAYKILGNPRKKYLYDKMGPESLRLYEDANEKTLYILKFLSSNICKGMTLFCGLITCAFCCGFCCCFCCCNFCCGQLVPNDLENQPDLYQQESQVDNTNNEIDVVSNNASLNSKTYLEQQDIPR